MEDTADSLAAWSLTEVLSTSNGPANNDVYGKLTNYLTAVLSKFYTRLHSLDLNFELFNTDAEKLGDHLLDRTFARVEVDQSFM